MASKNIITDAGIKELISKIKTALSGKAASSHTHTKSQITDFPTIPTVNNPTITITQGGATKGSFTLNQSGATTIVLTDNNTTYSAATTSAAGLMSAADKSKLDSMTAPASYTATFTADGWTGDAVPYTQSVTVSGVTASTKLFGMLDARNCADADTEKAMKKAYGYLTYFETEANIITATAKFEKPTVDVNVIFEVI